MSKIQVINILTITILLIIDSSSQECLCNVDRNGEYCGTELNEINGNSDCERNMYFCGDTNRNRPAVLLTECAEGRECDVKRFFRNACLINIQCECGRQLRRGQRYCGRDLNGKDCGPNVIFTCPYIGLFHPSPQDACPDGCLNGTCVSFEPKK